MPIPQPVTEPEPAATATLDLEVTFREHNRMVFWAAYRITGNASDAEDVMQTVFLRMARRETVGVTNMESYLRRSAVNAALDLVRSKQRTSSVSIDAVANYLQDPTLAPDRPRRDAEIRDRLRQAVARLSPAAAEMFALRYFEDRDNSEIADLVGTTIGTVAVTLHRSRERIQKELATDLMNWGGTQ